MVIFHIVMSTFTRGYFIESAQIQSQSIDCRGWLNYVQPHFLPISNVKNFPKCWAWPSHPSPAAKLQKMTKVPSTWKNRRCGTSPFSIARSSKNRQCPTSMLHYVRLPRGKLRKCHIVFLKKFGDVSPHSFQFPELLGMVVGMFYLNHILKKYTKRQKDGITFLERSHHDILSDTYSSILSDILYLAYLSGMSCGILSDILFLHYWGPAVPAELNRAREVRGGGLRFFSRWTQEAGCSSRPRDPHLAGENTTRHGWIWP